MLQPGAISKCSQRRTYRISFLFLQNFCIQIILNSMRFGRPPSPLAVLFNSPIKFHSSFLTLNSSSSDARVKPSLLRGLAIAALRRFTSSWSACSGMYDGRHITRDRACRPRRPGFLQIVALFLRPHLWHILSRLSIRSSTL